MASCKRRAVKLSKTRGAAVTGQVQRSPTTWGCKPPNEMQNVIPSTSMAHTLHNINFLVPGVFVMVFVGFVTFCCDLGCFYWITTDLVDLWWFWWIRNAFCTKSWFSALFVCFIAFLFCFDWFQCIWLICDGFGEFVTLFVQSHCFQHYFCVS